MRHDAVDLLTLAGEGAAITDLVTNSPSWFVAGVCLIGGLWHLGTRFIPAAITAVFARVDVRKALGVPAPRAPIRRRAGVSERRKPVAKRVRARRAA